VVPSTRRSTREGSRERHWSPGREQANSPADRSPLVDGGGASGSGRLTESELRVRTRLMTPAKALILCRFPPQRSCPATAQVGSSSLPRPTMPLARDLVMLATVDHSRQTLGAVPQTRYAKSGDVHIAYQVVGDGPRDLVFLSGLWTHVEHQWEEPSFARFLDRLGSFTRLIVVDARGAGLSDRAPELPPMEEQVDDVIAVLDAVGSASAAFFGLSQAGPMAILFAASHPERTQALILYGTYASPRQRDGYPWGRTGAWMDDYDRLIDEKWGSGVFLEQVAPSRARDPLFAEWWSKFERLSYGPGNALAYFRMNAQIDVRGILPTIGVPTLVLQRIQDVYRDKGHARYLAEHIPGAKLVELPGVDHLPYVGDSEAVLAEVEEFLTGMRPPPDPDRILATVLFTDIVGSTELASRVGDREWVQLLRRHHEIIRRHLAHFRGREMDTAGDGFFAVFDGPARSIRCAQAVVDELFNELKIRVRVGIHTGEIELLGSNARGLAVHIGARVAALAAPGEVLVSSTVRDLVAGSGIEFDERGLVSLKGVADEWRLFAARRSDTH
jgi:class 3 adenylate cyclase